LALRKHQRNKHADVLDGLVMVDDEQTYLDNFMASPPALALRSVRSCLLCRPLDRIRDCAQITAASSSSSRPADRNPER
jgi:hypothetical protein